MIWWRTAAWLVVSAAACSCTGPSERGVLRLGRIDDLAGLDHRMITSSPLVAAPGPRWVAADDGWSFRGSASLLVHVTEPPDGPLRLVAVPADDTADHRFTVTWDGLGLGASPRTLAPGSEPPEIERAVLTPGIHRLTVERERAAEPPEVRSRIDNSFASIGFAVGGRTTILAPGERDRLLRIAEFLDLGLTGPGPQRFAGCLTEGPAEITAEIEVAVASVLTAEVAEVTGLGGEFVLTAGDGTVSAEVPAGEHRRLELALDPGVHRVRWSSRGAVDALLLWGAPDLRPSDPPTAPPVVVITLDTTRRDALGIYGGPDGVSPRIDAFAATAAVYDDAHAVSPWTLPSHATILTGRYGTHHGAGVSRDQLEHDQLSLAELFRQQGYRTAGFAGGEMCSSRWGLGQGFQQYRDPEGFETRGDRLTDAALAAVRSSSDPRLFLFVNYFDPHALYRAPRPFRDRFDVDRLEEAVEGIPVWSDLAAGDGRAWRAIIAGEAPPPGPEVLTWLRAAYHAEVAYMDAQIGRLLDGLDEAGWLDPALVVMVADHGEFLGEHGFFSHACRLDPELTEVPLIVKWPFQEDGIRVASLVSQVDLFATLASLVDEGSPTTDGITLPRTAEESPTRTTVYMEEHETRIHPLFESMKIASHVYGLRRSESLEVVWEGGSTCESTTGDGWRSVPCEAGWQQRLSELSDLARRPLAGGAAAGRPTELSDAERERLEALGYIR